MTDVFQRIANRLTGIMPQFTDLFTDKVNITDITIDSTHINLTVDQPPEITRDNARVNLAAGDLVILTKTYYTTNITDYTVTNGVGAFATSTQHSLTRGYIQDVTLKNTGTPALDTTFSLTAPPKIKIVSIAYNELSESVTVVTQKPHGFIDNPAFIVNITGVINGDYNQKGVGITVINATTFSDRLYGTQPTALFTNAYVEPCFTENVFFAKTPSVPNTSGASGNIVNTQELGLNGPFCIDETPTSTTFKFIKPQGIFLENLSGGELHYNPRIMVFAPLEIFSNIPFVDKDYWLTIAPAGLTVSKDRDLKEVDLPVEGGYLIFDNNLVVNIIAPNPPERLKGYDYDAIYNLRKYVAYALNGFCVESSFVTKAYPLNLVGADFIRTADPRLTTFQMTFRFTEQMIDKAFVQTDAGFVTANGDYSVSKTQPLINVDTDINGKQTPGISLKQG